MKERGPVRKTVDKLFFGLSFFTLPLALITAGKSALAGEVLKTVVASGFAFVDYTQIREHGKPPTEQSWYNPEKIMDGLQRAIGRFRVGNPSRLSYVS